MYAYSVQPTANFSCNSWRVKEEEKQERENRRVSVYEIARLGAIQR